MAGSGITPLPDPTAPAPPGQPAIHGVSAHDQEIAAGIAEMALSLRLLVVEVQMLRAEVAEMDDRLFQSATSRGGWQP